VIRPPLRSLVLVALVVITALAASCSDATGGPAASVDGTDITHERVEADVAAFRFLSQLSGSPCGTPAEGETQDAACARIALTNEIQEEIIKAYAAEHDLSVVRGDVAEAIAQLEQNLGGTEELARQLSDAGFSRRGLEDLAERLLLFNVVQEALVAERLDDESLQALYEDAISQFTTLEVAHILLETREEAEDVAGRATLDNFARLARQLSIDSGSGRSGGSLGSFSEAQFVQQFDPTFVAASLELEPGEISGVVETQFGFHVIEMIRRDVAPFEDVRDQLSAEQGGQVFEEWLRERYETLEIEVNPRYGRLDRDSGEVVAIRSTEEEPSATGATGNAPASPSP
jgi:parvulin-like peptidyl-prolyl isomerase